MKMPDAFGSRAKMTVMATLVCGVLILATLGSGA